MRGTGPVLMLTALALLLAALPDLLRRFEPGAQPLRTLAAAAPAPDPAPLDPALRPLALLDDGLLDRLANADREWIPQAEPLPGGGTRYLYRRRPGDPELTLPQIRALIARPPSREVEQRAVVALLTTLERAGAGVGLIEPIRSGAAAEWDPQARTIRVRPDVPDQGSLEFARVLNHEAIHVAQSCAAGDVGAPPRPLGLFSPAERASGTSGGAGANGIEGVADPVATQHLRDAIYTDLSPVERRMEKEAYALQHRLDLGVRLLRIHCLDGGAG